jgi:hypothetical protein
MNGELYWPEFGVSQHRTPFDKLRTQLQYAFHFVSGYSGCDVEPKIILTRSGRQPVSKGDFRANSELRLLISEVITHISTALVRAS